MGALGTHISRKLVGPIAFALLATASAAFAQSTEGASYRDPSRPVAERVRDLLGRMTLEEKFWQLFMIPGDLDDPANDYSRGVFGLQISPARDTTDPARAHAKRINDIQRYFVERTRLGIPIIPFEEAVHGLVRPGATAFPAAIGMAATWDTSLMSRVAAAIADETRSRGIRQVLSPVVNIGNDPRWGRVEETYGEDPLLSSRMAVSFVSAFEKAGVVATPKHFVANFGDGGRDSYPIDLDARLLDEMYYPPFRAAILEGHARSVMSAYNSVNGSPATQNRGLLTDKLRRDWGFQGFVISDAAATGGATVLHHTEASTATATSDALNAGLDVIFQSSWPQHRPYLDAFKRGLIPDSVIDTAVARVLRAKFELGLFEHPYVDADSAKLVNGSAAHRALALDAAHASIVLLKNDGGSLPLAKSIRSIAVIGTDAVEARLGGYSGPGNAKISILDGITAALRERIPDGVVRYAPGPGRFAREYVVVPPEALSSTDSGRAARGLYGEYFDNNHLDGRPRLARTDARVDFGWTLNSPGRGIPFDWYSVRWTGRITVPTGGVRRIGVEANDGYRLYLDGKLLIDDWEKRSYGSRLASVKLAPGSSHDIRLEYFESTGNARVKLVWDAGVVDDWRGKIDSAVLVARRSQVAVVVAGIEEGEFRDRALLSLPGHQEQLIERVASTGRPTIVVLVGGGAITMSRWLDRVPAVVDAWYSGEFGGRAVADVLFGNYNPAGRLPTTWPMFEGQLPLYYNHKPTGRGDDYLDLTGQPLFPFGYGLSYTTFEYSNLSIESPEIAANGSTIVRCRVKNTGTRAGDEVVQLYVRDLLASVARPVMQLGGFRRLHLAPGAGQDIAFTVGREQLQMLDRDLHWLVEPGTFRVLIGASSRDIRLRGDLVVR
ncbi:MAG TPA: glycoside hydrolase family 3 N-terminal domain-containing protein [Gemmatimonadaceae bacterium]|jgi:beta-glucosidase|nr:glycoside hydrolase family 3 N-terminal domain-containing protein [Gemmatimonadaceae bacterium]